ncbi:transposase [Streptomyces sp. NPDC050759]|uniref:transposase n=1 Tax=Streptomyces sp. NPDC050759 TaxID=3365635 RepID=UPI003799A72C
MRIIDYTVTVRSQDGPPQVGKFRLATSLLDHRQATARQLAQLYHQRWEIENGFAELKNRLRGAGFIGGADDRCRSRRLAHRHGEREDLTRVRTHHGPHGSEDLPGARCMES